MATQRKRRYSTYGSVAYQPAYTDSAAHKQEQHKKPQQPQRRPRVQPRERTAVRPRVQVRQQDAFSPFAVVGFAAVLVSVFMLLSAGIQLVTVSHETYQLQSELDDLKTEESKLLAQYEMAYDLTAIEREMLSTGVMVKANQSNTIYLDMSEEDSVIYYAQGSGGLPGMVDALEQMFKDILS